MTLVVVSLLSVMFSHIGGPGAYWLAVESGAVTPGENTITFSVEDPMDRLIPWGGFRTVHESKIHVVVIRGDGGVVVHTHPEWSGSLSDADTVFSVDVTLPEGVGGWYYAAFTFSPIVTPDLIASYLMYEFNTDGRYWVLEGDELTLLCESEPSLLKLCNETSPLFVNRGLLTLWVTQSTSLVTKYTPMLSESTLSTRIYITPSNFTQSSTVATSSLPYECYSDDDPCTAWRGSDNDDVGYKGVLSGDLEFSVEDENGLRVVLGKYLSAPAHVYLMPEYGGGDEVAKVVHEHGEARGGDDDGGFTSVRFNTTLSSEEELGVYVVVQTVLKERGSVGVFVFFVNGTSPTPPPTCCPHGALPLWSTPAPTVTCLTHSPHPCPNPAQLPTPAERSIAGAYLRSITGCNSWRDPACFAFVGASWTGDTFTWSGSNLTVEDAALAEGYTHTPGRDCAFIGGIDTGRLAGYDCSQPLPYLCTTTCPTGSSVSDDNFEPQYLVATLVSLIFLVLMVTAVVRRKRHHQPLDQDIELPPVRLDSSVVGSIPDLSDADELESPRETLKHFDSV